MRLLHVSDWHIGRQTYRYSRVPDHEAALAEIVELARETRPHLVLHTGDVFDGFRPGYAEMSFAVEALEELAALAPVVVVAGNHDSPALFRLFDRLQGHDPRIRFVDRVRTPADGGVLDLPGSERPLHVSDAYATRPRRLPNVSYAAFGHTPLPQPLPRRVTGRYAGSPIPLDFGEEREQKEVVLVEAEPGRPAVVMPVGLSGGRPLRTLVGA